MSLVRLITFYVMYSLLQTFIKVKLEDIRIIGKSDIHFVQFGWSLGDSMVEFHPSYSRETSGRHSGYPDSTEILGPYFCDEDRPTFPHLRTVAPIRLGPLSKCTWRFWVWVKNSLEKSWINPYENLGFTPKTKLRARPFQTKTLACSCFAVTIYVNYVLSEVPLYINHGV